MQPHRLSAERVIAGRITKSALDSKKPKKGKTKGKLGGVDTLAVMMAKVHIEKRAKVEGMQRQARERVGLWFASKGHKKRTVKRVMDGDMEGQ